MGNYNNEIGVPLTIIGRETGGGSFLKWAGVMFSAFKLLLKRDKDYPQILILEMGADKPGDIVYLTKLAPCDIGVITGVASVHMEFFRSMKKIIKEKERIVTHVKKDGWAIINNDDKNISYLKDEVRAGVIKFGFSETSDVAAIESSVNYLPGMENKEALRGTNFKVKYKGGSVPVFLPGVIGRAQIYAALAGVSVGAALGMNLSEIADGLKNYCPPKGRMRLLDGIKKTLIIDDTYNASPVPTRAALKVLHSVSLGKDSKKFAVLGDMLELGQISEDEHLEIGEAVFDSLADVLITVGERARDIARGAQRAGMPNERIFSFNNSEEAGRFLQDRIYEGDLVLIKGSRGMRMEKAVKEIMAEPLRAEELLVH